MHPGDRSSTLLCSTTASVVLLAAPTRRLSDRRVSHEDDGSGSTPLGGTAVRGSLSGRASALQAGRAGFDSQAPYHGHVVQRKRQPAQTRSRRFAQVLRTGSNPSVATKSPCRLKARIAGFQSADEGSTPSGDAVETSMRRCAVWTFWVSASRPLVGSSSMEHVRPQTVRVHSTLGLTRLARCRGFDSRHELRFV